METTTHRTALMKKVRQSGTDLELLVRRALWGIGARFRTNVPSLPGRPDIANKARKKAIFVHGCFSHFHAHCSRGRLPKRNQEFWREKLQRNRMRDQEKIDALRALGFDVLVIFECELEVRSALTERLREFWWPKVAIGPKRVIDQARLFDFEVHEPTKVEVEAYEFDESKSRVVRRVLRRNATESASWYRVTHPVLSSSAASAFDAEWLRVPHRPRAEFSERVRFVDLFSGCGGMSIGIEEAGRALGIDASPVLAVDADPAACDVYRANFPGAEVVSTPIEMLVDSRVGEELSAVERELAGRLGHIELAVGGPPCQGHSDLNNFTRRNDPKNSLYAKMARFAEVVRPVHLVIENVNGILHDKGRVFQETRSSLERLGYSTASGVVHAQSLGVAQSRRRVFLLASFLRTREELKDALSPSDLGNARSFDWACVDLMSKLGESPFDDCARMTPENKARIDYLFENNLFDLPDSQRPECHQNGRHSYKSVYGRLRGSEPSQTITTGFMTMGQGRFVHPYCRRTLTPHEAARLQFFPDWFEFGKLPRGQYGKLIGNAVPSKMSYSIALELLR